MTFGTLQLELQQILEKHIKAYIRKYELDCTGQGRDEVL
jgi:hypothetical protein